MSSWITYQDPATQKPYYYNSESKITTWEKPADLEGKVLNAPEPVMIFQMGKQVTSGWMKCFDATTGKNYYTHAESSQTVWALPDGIVKQMQSTDLTNSKPLGPTTIGIDSSKPLAPRVSISEVSKPLAPPQKNPSSSPLMPHSHSRANSISGVASLGPAVPITGTPGHSRAPSMAMPVISESSSSVQPLKPIPKVISPKLDENSSKYEKLVDQTTGRYYYYNKITKDSSWDPPADYQAPDITGRHVRADSVSSRVPSGYKKYEPPKEIDSHSSVNANLRRSMAADLRKNIEKFQLKEFADQHFATHRKHHFFSKEDILVEDVISWQADTIYKNLLKVSDKSDSIQTFKWIQSFMKEGDHSKKSPEALVALLQEKGIKDPNIRDEIFAQLCKQTTRNPNPENTILGWKLFALCGSAFPPSRTFQDHLLKYVRTAADLGGRISSIALLSEYYIHRLTNKSLIKDRPVLNMINLAQLDAIVSRGINPVMFSFDYSLNRLLEVQHSFGDGASYPRILAILCESIKLLGGHRQQGIFRLAGNKSDILKARLLVENGEDFKADDANVPADLLKQWFRYMPEPVIPLEQFNECISVADKPDACMAVVQKHCTPEQKATLNFLIVFLLDMSQYSADTSMSIDNLALVFAPGIVQTKCEDPQLLLQYSSKQKQFLKNIIEKWSKMPL